jgi:L-aspartate oxidase
MTDDAGSACGVRVLDGTGRIGEVRADAVVLATGGLGQLWPVTTNPSIATADGLAAALRAGAAARDLEFIQFHPTVLAERDADGRGVLLSEALRGEGAVLVDRSGRRVMDRVHPLGDLAPRDVVSAAIMAHLADSGDDHVFLDLTALGATRLQRSFPGITRLCRERGYDPAHAPVPVLPAAHYSCGGIAADLWGRTSVPGLFAVGEVAGTGVHGANRLASNSLTEALVSGHRVGDLLSGALPRPGAPSARAVVSTADPSHLPALQTAMQEHVFVARSGGGLADALASLAEVLGSGTDPTGRAGHSDLTASNLALAARAITAAAALRTESRGCHRRVDHPTPAPAWERRIVITLADGRLRLSNGPLTHTERTAA